MSRLLLCVVLCAPSLAFGQSFVAADSVVGYLPGTGSGTFDPNFALGLPLSQSGTFPGSHVTSLGEGGSLTLGFSTNIVDGPGVDLLVMENGFEFPTGSGRIFAEVAFVEVSSNGVDFARFPTRYAGPTGPLANFGSEPMGTYAGMTGGLPVFADANLNNLRPDDPTEAGGEAFDLTVLQSHALVLGGQLDLNAIGFVRLVDAVAGVDVDSFGTTIWDNGGQPSSADIEAVVAINHAGLTPATGPEVDLAFDAQGRLILSISDVDGLQDIDFSRLRVRLNTTDLTVADLLTFFEITVPTPNQVLATTRGPLQGFGFKAVVAASIADFGGARCADQIFLQD